MISSELPEVLRRRRPRARHARGARSSAEFAATEADRGGDHRRRDRQAPRGERPHERPTARPAPAEPATPPLAAEHAAPSSSTSSSGSGSSGIVASWRCSSIVTTMHPAALPERARTQQFVLVDTTIYRAARDRRDDGRAHPERRPVGRLGARAVGLPRRPTCSAPPRHPDPARASSSGLGIGLALRDRERAARPRSARVPSLVVTLGDALHHPRHRHLVVGGGKVDRQLAAERVH